MATLFELQKKKDGVAYGKRLNNRELKQYFGVSGSYSFTHSTIDQSVFVFYGAVVGGNTKTILGPDGSLTIETALRGKHEYPEGILPEETELSDMVFLIEKKTDTQYVYRGIADLNEIDITKKSKSGKNSWIFHCIIHGQLRPEEQAYKYKTVEKDSLETIVYVPTVEGTKKAVYTTKYERKKANRDAAIAAHGTVCMACGFDFEKVYGEYGRGFIEVHHTKPLFENEDEVTPDPETDLICLCANCHRIVHHFRNRVLTLGELKQIIEEANK